MAKVKPQLIEPSTSIYVNAPIPPSTKFILFMFSNMIVLQVFKRLNMLPLDT